MNETTLTVTGNVVDTPKLRRTKNGHSVANFRIASSVRRFDREKSAWEDASTLFVNVTAWRGLADNIAQSVFKGQPVVVTGRYYQRDYTVDEQIRTYYELEATAVGHDLSRGVSTFERVTRPATITVERDEDGLPADASEHVYDFVDEDGMPEPGDAADDLVDRDTGEVRELAGVG